GTGADAPISNDGDEAAAGQRRASFAQGRRSRPSFAQWRRSRPFFAGLLMLLGGVVILTPAYLSLEVSNIIIQVSTISGVSTFIIGALLIACGLMTWFGGGSRILTGVAGIILGIVALPTSNFGGFVLGTLLALVGGALALSWTESSKEELAAQRESKKQQKAERDAHDLRSQQLQRCCGSRSRHRDRAGRGPDCHGGSTTGAGAAGTAEVPRAAGRTQGPGGGEAPGTATACRTQAAGNPKAPGSS